MKLLMFGGAAAALAAVAYAVFPDDDDTVVPSPPANDAVTTTLEIQAEDVPPPAVAVQAGQADEAQAAGIDVSEIPLTVFLDGEPLPYDVWHHLVMPGETVSVTANLPLDFEMNGRSLAEAKSDVEWTAPDRPGTHRLTVADEAGRERQVTVFVLAPLDRNEILEGYRIGTYPRDTPQGLIRLTRSDMDAPISPHFTIGQFICKQQPGHWPKFLVVSASMLTRLEALLDSLHAEDLTQADTFFIMSGYRTPFYNTAIGSARFSRHMYGDAADIYPDVVGGDGVMDDLNGDGRITRADAEFLYDFAEGLYTASPVLPAGGIGAYGANAVHGPFVHIDGRGRPARWGRHGS